jgi:hypothetical protein
MCVCHRFTLWTVRMCSNFACTQWCTVCVAFEKSFKSGNQEYLVQIVDTAGQDEYSILSQNCTMNVHGYVLVYSTTSQKRFVFLSNSFNYVSCTQGCIRIGMGHGMVVLCVCVSIVFWCMCVFVWVGGCMFTLMFVLCLPLHSFLLCVLCVLVWLLVWLCAMCTCLAIGVAVCYVYLSGYWCGCAVLCTCLAIVVAVCCVLVWLLVWLCAVYLSGYWCGCVLCTCLAIGVAVCCVLVWLLVWLCAVYLSGYWCGCVLWNFEGGMAFFVPVLM